jgi:lipoprotein-anchoring transpeptidase ErfK/SrfK
MQRSSIPILTFALTVSGAAMAQSLPPPPLATTPPMVEVSQPPQMRSNLGGGFIEFLFSGTSRQQHAAASGLQYIAPPQINREVPQSVPTYANVNPAADPAPEQNIRAREMDPRYIRREVAYQTGEAPGTIVIDTPNHFLYLVQTDGKAMRYGIGVGRPGFTWSGVHKVSAKKEWPDWTPPDEMLKRQPWLPHFMAGGPNNPLGARALYLGSTLYRIHGSNEPWTIGHNVSSGCIRLRNADVIDLYDRVNVGARVVVL